MQVLQSAACLLAICFALIWFMYRVVRMSVALRKADIGKRLRWLVSVVVWVAVSMLAHWLGAKNYFVLGGGAAVVALVGFYPNWGIGLVLFLVGLPSAISGFVNSLFWPSHSVSDVLLLSSSINVIFSGSLATGYGFFLCGTVSFLWGLAVGEGFPKAGLLRNGAPFTVESDVPEHVIQIPQSQR